MHKLLTYIFYITEGSAADEFENTWISRHQGRQDHEEVPTEEQPKTALRDPGTDDTCLNKKRKAGYASSPETTSPMFPAYRTRSSPRKIPRKVLTT